MLRRRLLTMVLFSITALLLPSHAQSTTALLLTDAEQAGLSTAVIVASVGAQRVEFNEDLRTTVTRTRLDVVEVLYGVAPSVLDIEQIGGRLGDRIVSLPGDAKLRTGEVCVLFLFKNKQGWYLTALQQSKYSLSDGEGGVPMLSRELGDGIVRRDNKGNLVSPSEDARRSSSSLEEFRLLLRAVSQPGKKTQ
jgi:hypothetical protein